MHRELRRFLGMGGIPPHDNPHAYIWERRLHWVMIVAALLSIPAFYLEDSASPVVLRTLGLELDLVIFSVFAGELLWMLYLTRQKVTYIKTNWLNLLIILGAGLNAVGWQTEWVALLRVLRVLYVGLILARLFSSLRNLFTPDAIISVVILGMMVMGVAGAGFYWLEPTVHSFGDGLWLAFVTATTVGYGDFVPTSMAARLLAMLMVVIGFSILSLMTASIAAFFVGEDEKRLRHEMHSDIKELRDEVGKLRAEMRELMQQKTGQATGVGPENRDSGKT